MDIVKLNVGGRVHQTTISTINKFPDTLLGKLLDKSNESIAKKDQDGCFFFDRNPDLFSFVLDFYRTGEIVYPTYVTKDDFLNEVKFWGIDVTNEEFPTIDEIVNWNSLFIDLEWEKKNGTYYSKTITDIYRLIDEIKQCVKNGKRRGCVAFAHENEDLFESFNMKKIEKINARVDYNELEGDWISEYKGNKYSVREKFIVKINDINCAEWIEFEF